MGHTTLISGDSVRTGATAILPHGGNLYQGKDWTLAQPRNEKVLSVNAIVGETNDGYLNDIRARPESHARARASATVSCPVKGPAG